VTLFVVIAVCVFGLGIFWIADQHRQIESLSDELAQHRKYVDEDDDEESYDYADDEDEDEET